MLVPNLQRPQLLIHPMSAYLYPLIVLEAPDPMRWNCAHHKRAHTWIADLPRQVVQDHHV